MFSLTKKTAIVTGGGSGIGRAVAELFARQGATVHVLELNIAGAEESVKSITAAGGKAHAWACNVADQQQVNHTVAEIVKESGGVNILLNSAGIAHIGKLENTPETDFDRVFQVNVKGVYNTMQAVVGPMKKQGGG